MKKNLPLRLEKLLTPELLIGLVFIILTNSFLVPQSTTIKADGLGYYDYLPAIFIYKDFPSKGITPSTEISDRINNLPIYIQYKDCIIDKYPCGTALLMSPFFVTAHLAAPLLGANRDGFSAPYQSSIFSAAMFYLLFGLYFLRKLLELYDISKINIILVQFLAVFGTGLTHYTYYDPSFSHVYSFFAITAFLYFVKSYFQERDNTSFILASLFFGVIILIRQINGIIILFVPFIAESFPVLKDNILETLRKPTLLFKALVIVLLIFSIQSILWYIETGKLFIYSYQGEGFNFLKPAFSKLLFSYRKGLFVYAPLLFLSLSGLYFLLTKKLFFQLISWLSFFCLLTYIISSWWSWTFGASFGHRAFVDYYTIFLIPLAFLLQDLKGVAKWIFLLICLLTIPLNLIQTKQYQSYILYWGDMTKQGYWKVFLHLDDTYKSILWKKHYDFNNSNTTILDSILLDNIKVAQESWISVLDKKTMEFHSFEKVNILQVQFRNRFSSTDKAKIVVAIEDSTANNLSFYKEVPVIHFADDKLNKYQLGTYNFEIPTVIDSTHCRLKIHVKTEGHALDLDDFKIRLINHRQ